YGNIAIGPLGEVMVSFQDSRTSVGAGPGTIWTALNPFGLAPLPPGVTEGDRFTEPQKVTDTNVGPNASIPAQPLTKAAPHGIHASSRLTWDISPLSPFRTRIYLVYTDDPSGVPDADASKPSSNPNIDTNIFVRWKDLNTDWSNPVRVSTDNGTHSAF